MSFRRDILQDSQPQITTTEIIAPDLEDFAQIQQGASGRRSNALQFLPTIEVFDNSTPVTPVSPSLEQPADSTPSGSQTTGGDAGEVRSIVENPIAAGPGSAATQLDALTSTERQAAEAGAQGQHRRAQELFEQALEEIRARDGENSIDLARARLRYASYLEQRESNTTDWSNRLVLQEKIIRQRELAAQAFRHQQPATLEGAGALRLVGETYLRYGVPGQAGSGWESIGARAESALADAARIYEQNPQRRNNVEYASCLSNLIQAQLRNHHGREGVRALEALAQLSQQPGHSLQERASILTLCCERMQQFIPAHTDLIVSAGQSLRAGVDGLNCSQLSAVHAERLRESLWGVARRLNESGRSHEACRFFQSAHRVFEATGGQNVTNFGSFVEHYTNALQASDQLAGHPEVWNHLVSRLLTNPQQYGPALERLATASADNTQRIVQSILETSAAGASDGAASRTQLLRHLLACLRAHPEAAVEQLSRAASSEQGNPLAVSALAQLAGGDYALAARRSAAAALEQAASQPAERGRAALQALVQAALSAPEGGRALLNLAERAEQRERVAGALGQNPSAVDHLAQAARQGSATAAELLSLLAATNSTNRAVTENARQQVEQLSSRQVSTDGRILAFPNDVQVSATGGALYARLQRAPEGSTERQLLSELNAYLRRRDGATDDQLPRNQRWFQTLTEHAFLGNSDARALLVRLAELPGCRDTVLQAALNQYRPQDRNALPLMVALATGDRTLSAEHATGSPQQLESWRRALAAASRQIQSGLDAPGQQTYPPAAIRPLVQILGITAAGPGSHANEAASALASLRYARELPTFLVRLFDGGRELGHEGNAYLLNLVHSICSRSAEAAYQRPYRHEPITTDHAAELTQGRQFASPGILRVLASGGFGSEAQVAVAGSAHDQQVTAGGERNLPAGLLDSLRSSDAHTVSGACSADNLGRLVALARNNPAHRQLIVEALVEAYGTARSQSGRLPADLLQAIAGATGRDGIPILARLARQNKNALTVITAMATGLVSSYEGRDRQRLLGIGETAQAARRTLMEIAHDNEGLRHSVCRNLFSLPGMGADTGLISMATSLVLGRSPELTGTEAAAGRFWPVSPSAQHPEALRANINELTNAAQNGNQAALQLLAAMAGAPALPSEGQVRSQPGSDQPAGQSAQRPPHVRMAMEAVARLTGVTLNPTDSNRTDFNALLRAVAQRAQSEGSQICTEFCVQSALTQALPQAARREAVGSLEQLVAGPRGEAVISSLLSCWRSQHEPMALQLMAELSGAVTNMPPELRRSITQELQQGYEQLTTRPPSMSEAEHRQRCACAARSMAGNPAFWTQDTVSYIARHLTPEMVTALHGAEHIPETNVRQLLTELRQVCHQPASGTDVSAVAGTISSFSRLATAEDVTALARLRQHAEQSNDGLGRRATCQALFAICMNGQDRVARQSALAALGSLDLSQEQTAAVRQFVNEGHANLTHLRQACDRMLGDSNRSYPLAVLLNMYGVHPPGLDQETCRLADSIMSHIRYGGNRTIQGWVVPALTAARMRSDSGANPDQTVTEMASDLAGGRLRPEFELLLNELPHTRDRLQQLQLQRQQVVNEIAQLSRQLGEIPVQIERHRAAMEQANAAYFTSLGHRRPDRRLGGSGGGPCLYRPPVGRPDGNAANYQAQQQQRLNEFAPIRTQLEAAAQRLGRLDRQIESHQATLQEASYYHLRTTNNAQADLAILQNWGESGFSGRCNLWPELHRVWNELRRRQLAPLDHPPEEVLEPGAAARILRTLTLSPHLEALPQADRQLHTACVDATARRCIHALTDTPATRHLQQVQQEMATYSATMFQLYQLARGGTENNQLVTFLRQHGNDLLRLLNSPQTQQALDESRRQIQSLTTQMRDMPEGSLGRQRLQEAVNALQTQVRALDTSEGTNNPLGAQLRNLQLLMTEVNSGRLDPENLAQRVLGTVGHVVVATATFAVVAGACAATCGAAAPLAVALLAPMATVLTRHGAQECLHHLGISNQPSELFDFMNGRAVYNPTSGQFEQITAGRMAGHLGQEYLWEGAMNLATMGAGRAGSMLAMRGAGGGTRIALSAENQAAQGTVLGRAARRFGHSLWENCNPGTIGIGLALAAPSLVDGTPDWLQAGLGIGFAGVHSYISVRRQFAPRRITSTEQLHSLPANVRGNLDQLVNQQPANQRSRFRESMLDIFRHVPEGLDHDVAQMILRQGEPAHQARLVEQLGRIPARERGSFVQHLLAYERSGQFSAREVREMMQNVERLPQEQRDGLLRRLNELPNGEAGAAIMETIANEALRFPQPLDRGTVVTGLLRLSAENTQALAAVSNARTRATVLADLAAQPEATVRRVNEQLQRLPSGERIALFELLGGSSVQTRSWMMEAFAHPTQQGGRSSNPWLEALGRVAQPVRARAFIDRLAALEANARTGMLEAFNGASLETRVHLISELGGLGREHCGNVMESLAGITIGTTRRTAIESLGRLGPAELGPVLSALGRNPSPASRRHVLEGWAAMPEPQQRLLAETLGRIGDPVSAVRVLEAVTGLSQTERRSLNQTLNGQSDPVRRAEMLADFARLDQVGRRNVLRPEEGANTAPGTPAEAWHRFQEAVARENGLHADRLRATLDSTFTNNILQVFETHLGTRLRDRLQPLQQELSQLTGQLQPLSQAERWLDTAIERTMGRQAFDRAVQESMNNGLSRSAAVDRVVETAVAGNPQEFLALQSAHAHLRFTESNLSNQIARHSALRERIQNSVRESVQEVCATVPELRGFLSADGRVPVDIVDNLGNRGEYHPDTGRILLDSSLLSNPHQLAGVIAHELVHHDQYGLVLRDVARRMGIDPQSANIAQLNQLGRAFAQEVGLPPGSVAAPEGFAITMQQEQQLERLGRMLRGHGPLSPEQQSRAVAVAEALRNYHDLQATNNNVRRIDNHLYNLERTLSSGIPNDPVRQQETRALLQALSSSDRGPEFRRILFGGDIVPAEIERAVNAFRSNPEMELGEARAALTRSLHERQQQLSIQQQQGENHYLALLSEREARAVQTRLLRRLGVSEDTLPHLAPARVETPSRPGAVHSHDLPAALPAAVHAQMLAINRVIASEAQRTCVQTMLQRATGEVQQLLLARLQHLTRENRLPANFAQELQTLERLATACRLGSRREATSAIAALSPTALEHPAMRRLVAEAIRSVSSLDTPTDLCALAERLRNVPEAVAAIRQRLIQEAGRTDLLLTDTALNNVRQIGEAFAVRDHLPLIEGQQAIRRIPDAGHRQLVLLLLNEVPEGARRHLLRHMPALVARENGAALCRRIDALCSAMRLVHDAARGDTPPIAEVIRSSQISQETLSNPAFTDYMAELTRAPHQSTGVGPARHHALSRYAALHRRQREIIRPALNDSEHEEYVRLRNQLRGPLRAAHSPIVDSLAQLRRGLSPAAHEFNADGTMRIPPGGRSGEMTQVMAFNHMQRLLDIPTAALNGNTPRAAGYELVPVRSGTTVDGIGWDVLLVNRHTGEFVHIDIKEYDPGNRYPRFHNQNGIYGEGNQGSPASIRPRDRNFVGQRFEEIIGRLHRQGSPLNIAGLNIPVESATVLPNQLYLDNINRYPHSAERTWSEWQAAIEARQSGLNQLWPQLEQLRDSHHANGRIDWAGVVDDLMNTTCRRHGEWLRRLHEAVRTRNMNEARRLINSER